MGGVNVTLAKALLSILVDITDSGFSAVFGSWVLYFVASLIVITYVLELNLTASGLEQASALTPL